MIDGMTNVINHKRKRRFLPSSSRSLASYHLPSTRAEKLRGVPSPIPLLSNTPHANQIAELKFSASSSVPSLFVNLYLPNGENLCCVLFFRRNTYRNVIPLKSEWMNECIISVIEMWKKRKNEREILLIYIHAIVRIEIKGR